MQKVTPQATSTSSRKADHIRINLRKDVSSGLTNGLENFHFIHQALPESNLSEINLSTSLFGHILNAPILISSMTGGTEEAQSINRTLAIAAQETGICMGVGSQRVAIENPDLALTFQVREEAPDILLFANIGAIQLNYGYTYEHCQKAVDMINADALILHLNPLQEAVQPEGEANFANLLSKIEMVCQILPVPVIVKEVGWGISINVARQLADAGVAAIDVAGAGGTSWTEVEKHRNDNMRQAHLASTFKDWGIPTAESIIQVRKGAAQLPIIASGGLRTGLDIAKCIALGASVGGIANPFLKAANQSIEETITTIEEIVNQIRVTMFASGNQHIGQLGKTTLIES